MWGVYLFWALAVLILVMIFDVIRQHRETVLFLRYIRRDLRESAAGAALSSSPKTAVVLSLRGPDPFLTQALEALLNQDYPDFQIHVIVDSELDPVLQDVRAFQSSGAEERIQVSVLRQVRRTCSLKCSSLIQAVTDLPEDVEVVAFIDGDVVPHRTWLTELVRPLVQGQADVAGGNRWYQPPDATWGSMTRFMWNCAFLQGMWMQGAPWAGTMAMRRSTMERIDLLEAWSTAMSVDATLHRCMRAHGLKFKLIASLIMTNRESISLPRFHGWVTRQMVVIRYSASTTQAAIQIQIGILLLVHAVIPVIAIAAFLTGHPQIGVAAVVSLCAYWMIHAVAVVLTEHTIRIGMRHRGEETRWITLRKAWRWYLSMALVHYVIGFGVLKVLGINYVDWRGIRYQLTGNGVEMESYSHFGAELSPQDNHSIV